MTNRFAEPMARLIEEFRKLPGVGTKSAQRLAFHVLRSSEEDAERLADAIRELKAHLRLCSVCNNITDVDPCGYCTSPVRNQRVVSKPLASSRSVQLPGSSLATMIMVTMPKKAVIGIVVVSTLANRIVSKAAPKSHIIRPFRGGPIVTGPGNFRIVSLLSFILTCRRSLVGSVCLLVKCRTMRQTISANMASGMVSATNRMLVAISESN